MKKIIILFIFGVNALGCASGEANKEGELTIDTAIASMDIAEGSDSLIMEDLMIDSAFIDSME